MTNKTIEHNLTVSAMSGDADAFCRLYEIYKHRLYRYARYRLGNDPDAEDAVSECFLSAWKQIADLRDPGAFGGWMFTILSGHCGRIIASQVESRKQISLDDPKVTGTLQLASGAKATDASHHPSGAKATDALHPGSAADDMDAADTRLMLEEALAALSEEDKSIVLLSIIGGFKSREIAAITGLRPGSVRSRLSRVLGKMRNMLENGEAK